MSTINILIDITEEQEHYLSSSARIRGISRTQLIRSVVENVLNDQLVLSILDDGDRPGPATAPLRRHRGPGRPRTEEAVPKDKLFDAVPKRRAPSVPTRIPPNANTFSFRKVAAKTRRQLEAELQQAVLNTGGELIE